MNKDMLIRALSAYPLEEVMVMVNQSHQLKSETKEVSQEQLQQLANELKNIQSVSTVEIPLSNVSGKIIIDLDWDTDTAYIDGTRLEISTDDENSKSLETLYNERGGCLEDIPSKAVQSLLGKQRRFREKLEDIAEDHGIDLWDLSLDICQFVDDTPRGKVRYRARRNPRRRRRARKKRLG